jgi:hypothetical protein
MDPYLEGSLWTTFHFALEGEALLAADDLLRAAGKRHA